ncbi:DUF1080 domain-containing protein [Verrucomicrobiaceae bacterium 5K15]|uniref:DUF1080 domain-containing protein n=1 Tax=Oceaniferula flava TaxID=2800421 RepID=A0AAE2V8K7_9BACT|nr:DUF1080 domain-containing protein [Oceaniferula flavus]MBK1855717.1 DUF1080 domain-containing protein [Oceaniferula flavus]MBM1137024.1 DUF1080 domain-containing protein [Oceaniferula flavus]
MILSKFQYGIAIAACSIPLMVSAQVNELTKQEQQEGWQLLFDGKTFEGWRNYQGKGVRDGWQVVDGTMHHTKGGKDLMTEKQYEDFEFKLEWKISEGGNSGIFLGVREIKDRISRSGIEMQIIDNERHPDAKNEKNVSGACYALYKPPVGADRKAGEWNQVYIIKKGSHYQFFQNGVKTADFDLEDTEFIDRIAAAKFKDWPHFARYRKGHIGLQDHGDVVSFRNIKLKNLSAKD